MLIEFAYMVAISSVSFLLHKAQLVDEDLIKAKLELETDSVYLFGAQPNGRARGGN